MRGGSFRRGKAEALRFFGLIAGVGTVSGTRLVIGVWVESPFGAIVDVMIEAPDGTRTLIAPSAEVADFIAGTYNFDHVQIEATTSHRTAAELRVTTDSLSVRIATGRRTAVGWMLRAVPLRLATSRWWCRVIDPFARALRPGVHTHGTAGNGRREYYCARDERSIDAVQAVRDGEDLGELRPVSPPVRFGFGSSPATPSLVEMITLIDVP